MLTRGMKNQSIQFYFNRQDRPVNSGRITQIRQGTYGAGIPSATDAALESFLAAFLPGSVTGPSTPPPSSREDGIVAMFAPTNDGGWHLTSGETDELECKRDFDLKKPALVVRAIVGMANNKGGTILLGVEDKSGKVVGLPDDNFAKIDLVKLTLAVKAHLQPTPSFFKGVVEIGGLLIGYVCVEPLVDKPVIVHRPGERLDDGAILLRYPAETAAIKFGDLKTLLDERDARRLGALVEATRKMAAIGVENAAILNVENGALDVAGRPMLIDQALVDQIKFIREGQFDEVAGAPALKLVGEIRSLGGDKLPAGRRLITDEDALRNFLDQETLLEPIEYIRWAVAGTNRDWMPVFYFALRASMTASELAGFIGEIRTTKTTARTRVVAHALGKRSAYAKPLGTPAKYLSAIIDRTCLPPPDVKTAGIIALALQGLPSKDPPPQADVLGLLSACATVLIQEGQVAAMSHVYRAAGRLDEVYFAPALGKNPSTRNRCRLRSCLLAIQIQTLGWIVGASDETL